MDIGKRIPIAKRIIIIFVRFFIFQSSVLQHHICAMNSLIQAWHIALRSWKLVPFAYYIRGKRNALELKKEEFEFLFICDGKTELPSVDIKKDLEELLEGSTSLYYFANGEAFLAAWQPGAFDLILLDIFMDRMTGMEVAREVRKTDQTVKIAFCTSSNEYASESYEVNACYYLHKPFGKEQLRAMLGRLNLSEIEKSRTAKLPGGTSVVLRSILYADCSSHCTTLHCKDAHNIVVRANFSEIEKILSVYPYFFSPTKGVTVNFHEVSSQNKDTFTLSNGAIIPISRRKAKEAQDSYSSFLFERLRRGGDC